jgi:TonB family protein
MKSKHVSLKVIITFLFLFTLTYNGIARKDTNTVFTVVQKMPRFPGGSEALLKYFQYNLTYPEDARKDKIEAHIIVEFIVEPDGSLTNIKIIRGSRYESLNNEAIRVIAQMPKWIPGKHKRKFVRVRCIQPIGFRLEE